MDSLNGVLDILAVVIGLSAVMLLLAMVVTAVVQAIQNLFKMRPAALRAGLDSAFAKALASKEGAEASTWTADKIKTLVDGVLAEGELPEPTTSLGRFVNLLAPRARSWMKPKELSEYLRLYLSHAKDSIISDQQFAEIVQRFDLSDKMMTLRFVGHVRVVTLLCSLGVAIVFQVSTIDLLTKLITEPAFRAAAEQVGSTLASDQTVAARVATGAEYQDVSERALAQLAVEFPDLEERIEEASGIGSNATVLGELQAVLSDPPADNRDQVLERYHEILDEMNAQQAREAMDDARRWSGYLAALNITPFRMGIEFYYSAMNWLGMLITTIALMLGAPFWFNLLKSSVGLRDTLKPPEEEATA